MDQAEEVAQLDRLLLRLALTEDSKLEKVLSKLLPAAITRLASPHDASRQKVQTMCSYCKILMTRLLVAPPAPLS